MTTRFTVNKSVSRLTRIFVNTPSTTMQSVSLANVLPTASLKTFDLTSTPLNKHFTCTESYSVSYCCRAPTPSASSQCCALSRTTLMTSARFSDVCFAVAVTSTLMTSSRVFISSQLYCFCSRSLKALNMLGLSK